MQLNTTIFKFIKLTCYFIFILFAITNCKKDSTSIEAIEAIDPLYANVDSSTIMICKINDLPFYGEKDHKTDITYNSGIYINVDDTTENIGLKLTSSIYNRDISHISYSLYDILEYNGITYNLITSSPYIFTTSILSDKLIVGEFYGLFVNMDINDTITVNNGYFQFKPEIPNDSYLSCYLEGNFFETTSINENFRRQGKRFKSIDWQFMDSTVAKIKLNVGSFTEDFTRTFYLWKGNSNALVYVIIDDESPPYISHYFAINGFIEVEELTTVITIDSYTGEEQESIEVSKASFEFEAEDNQGNIISITEGHYSLNGFK